MAEFEMQLPDDVLKDVDFLYSNADSIFGQMTRAGAKVVQKMIRANVPDSFRSSNIMDCLKVTRTYKTPTDDGINTKVAFYGYFTNSHGVKTPAPLVCNVFEYGSTKFGKQPFMRRSFNKSEIEQAMLKEQKKATGGIL